MHWISVIIGLVVAWAIIFFIGPKPYVVSYYEPVADEPVVGVAMSELDAMMMAVGLISESTIEVAPSPAPAPAPAPMMESVADMAMMDTDLSMAMMDNEFSMSPAPAPSPMEISESTEDLSGQDTGAIPPPF
jgi:hypothetical protein